MLIWGPANAFEAAWTAAALFGFANSLYLLVDSLKSKHYQEAQPDYDAAMEIIAGGIVTNEWFRIAVHTIGAFIGIIAMSQPPINPAHPLHPLSIVLSSGLVVMHLLLVAMSWHARWVRRRALTQLRKQAAIRKRLEAL
jgi:hypothetical protein